MEQEFYGILLYRRGHRVEHIKACHFVLDNGIPVTERLKPYALTQLIHIVDMSHPLRVYDFKQYYALDLAHLLGFGEFRLLSLVKLDSLFLEVMDKLVFFLILARVSDRLHRNDREKRIVKLRKVPLLRRKLVAYALVDYALNLLGKHIHNNSAHALAVKHPSSFLVNDLSLVVVDLIVLKEIFTDTEVVVLYLFLCLLYRVGKHLMLYLFVLGDP